MEDWLPEPVVEDIADMHDDTMEPDGAAAYTTDRVRGTRTIVDVIESYVYRGEAYADMSFVEYRCCVEVAGVQRERRAKDDAEGLTVDGGRGRGRGETLVPFAPPHPLHGTNRLGAVSENHLQCAMLQPPRVPVTSRKVHVRRPHG